jgi:hypothetical protein
MNYGADYRHRIGKWRLGRWAYPGARLEAVSDGGVDVDCDGEHVTVEWSEPAGDYYGTCSRSVSIPCGVLRMLLDDDPGSHWFRRAAWLQLTTTGSGERR